MCFENITFIKPDIRLDRKFTGENFAPLFRKKLHIDFSGKAVVSICCLGIGYCYINGERISGDLFTAPCSDYTRTLWYNEYDVSDMLKVGENVIAVWCGNGWYNEDFETDWGHCRAAWRDVPKFIFKLEIDGKIVAVSDNSWKCCRNSAVWFNDLRSGEYFDARKFDESWTSAVFDDSDWEQASEDTAQPTGVFRKCVCEPICEAAELSPVSVLKTDDGKFVYDLGQNISGYVRLTACGKPGQLLTIKYAEQINDDHSLQLNGMEGCYKESEFQTDKFICSGKKTVWSPRFAYHGFRYIQIDGIGSADEIGVKGVFVHQNIKKLTEFECSDEFLTKLFHASEISVYSNMFYMLTDCPTREKLGWTNDAQSSAENVLLNFEGEKLLEKWLYDIYDAMREDGALPGIVPTPGWGYEWGNGPVSDGVLFEIPYQIYMLTGNSEPLTRSIPYFERYFKYLDTRREDGFVKFGLSDWAKPGFLADWQHCDIPTELVNAVMEYGFCEKAALAKRLANLSDAEFSARKNRIKEAVFEHFTDDSGRCTVNKQTAISLLICFGLYEDIETLKNQLKEAVESSNFHHDCGMVGMRRLLHALVKCGLQEYAYEILTADGYPGYKDWFSQGATTLWEYWDWQEHSDSKNHHMYSDVMSWITKNILGVGNFKGSITVEPYFFGKLNFVKGSYRTAEGKIMIAWQRHDDGVDLTIDVPENSRVFYKNKRLEAGKNAFHIVTSDK